MDKKKLSILIIVVSVIIVSGVIYYLKVNQPTEEEFNYQDLVIFEAKNENLPKWKQEEYFEEFLAIREGLSKDPDDFNAWLALGRIQKQLGDFDMAEKTWTYAGVIRPKNSPSFANLGSLYMNFKQDFEKSESNYLIAIKNSEGEGFNINYTRSLFELYLYYMEEKIDYADDFIQERIEKYPENADLLGLMAFYYKEIKDFQKAIEWYEKYLELDPGNQGIIADIEKLRLKL